MKVKAVALVSGGLDSLIAVKLVKDQGIDVTAVTFKNPFHQGDHVKMIERNLKKMIKLSSAMLILMENMRDIHGTQMAHFLILQVFVII